METRTLPSGDPQDPRTVIGPLITPMAVKLVDERVKEALAKGAKLHAGGTYEGQIYQPTILSNVPLDAAIANEETFGPVVVVEVVFVYPGVGQAMVDAVRTRDVPVVQACALFFAAVYILLNLTADIIAIITNPRLLHPR